MATQYTAGLSVGQVLTAATMNSIGAAWETWTPTFTASSGSFSSLTTHFARYGRIQNTVYGAAYVEIVNLGTASGVMLFTLPVTARTGTYFLSAGTYRDIWITGFSGVVSLDSTTQGSLRRYDNVGYLQASQRFTFSFQYEAA